jgi:hypothetical protein
MGSICLCLGHTICDLDKMRWAVFVDGSLLITSFFYALLGTKGPDVTYISDLDYTRPDYKIIVSTLVFLQIINTLVYAFGRRERHIVEFIFIIIFLLTATIGWSIVSFLKEDEHRSERNSASSHIWGARLYVFGHLFVFCFLIRDIWQTKGKNLVLFVCMVTCFIMCISFGLVFVQNSSWVIEHLLFLSFLLGHFLFSILSDLHNDQMPVHHGVDVHGEAYRRDRSPGAF